LASLQQQLQTATTYEEWKECALQIDQLEGNEEWKDDPQSSEYDYEMVRNRLEELRYARRTKDKASISFILRTSIT
jgi:TAG lipase / steryl ester hydrolase / phospholipase A2 / LPA acyltransferase